MSLLFQEGRGSWTRTRENLKNKAADGKETKGICSLLRKRRTGGGVSPKEKWQRMAGDHVWRLSYLVPQRLQLFLAP